MGLFGAPNVERLLAKRDVPGLIKALGAFGYEGDERVRRNAASALGQIGDKNAGEPLLVALADDDGQVRSAAAWALGEIREARAAEPLMTIAVNRAEIFWVRQSAAEALVQIGIPGAENMKVALKDVMGFEEDQEYEIEAAESALAELAERATRVSE